MALSGEKNSFYVEMEVRTLSKSLNLSSTGSRSQGQIGRRPKYMAVGTGFFYSG